MVDSKCNRLLTNTGRLSDILILRSHIFNSFQQTVLILSDDLTQERHLVIGCSNIMKTPEYRI